MSIQTTYCPPTLEEAVSSSSSSSSSTSTSTSPSTSNSPGSTSPTSPSSSSQFAPITRPGAILNISGALLRSAKKRQIARQEIEVTKSVETLEYTFRLSQIAYASMCLEGQVPMPSATMQHPTEQLYVDKVFGAWNPFKDPFFSLITTTAEFRESHLSPEERRVATPAEIRRAMKGKLPEMRGLWTDIIMNNFKREPKEMGKELTEEEKEEDPEENREKRSKPIVYDGPPNMTSAFDESDDEGADDEEEAKVKVAQVAKKATGMVAEVQKVVEIEMVDVKKGDVKEIDIKPMPMPMPMPTLKTTLKTTITTTTPSRLPKRKSQWTELQGRLQRATEKMKQLVSCNGGDHFENSDEPALPSARTACLPPPSLKIVGRAPPPRPNWIHCSVFDEACLEQFLNCNCASSVEKCPGCIPSAVRVAVDEDLI